MVTGISMQYKRFTSESKDDVRFYTVHGGGHDWPGAWGNMDINASEERKRIKVQTVNSASDEIFGL